MNNQNPLGRDKKENRIGTEKEFGSILEENVKIVLRRKEKQWCEMEAKLA